MSASNSELKWVDNHCHFEENDEVALDLQEAANKGVEKFIVVGTDLETSLKAKELSQIFPEKIFATAGIHPHEAIQLRCFDGRFARPVQVCRSRPQTHRVPVHRVGDQGRDLPRAHQLRAHDWRGRWPHCQGRDACHVR